MASFPVQCSAQRFETLLLERYILAPNFSRALPRHVHEEYQVSLSLTDPCRHFYRGAAHAAPTGALSVLHPGEVHSSPDLLVSPAPSVFHVLYVPPEAMRLMAADRTGRAVSAPFFAAPVLSDAALAKRFRQLWRCLTGPASRLEQDSLLLLVLTQMIARHAPGPLTADRSHPGTRPLDAARDYLHAHCAEDLTLDALAQVASLSPFHFCRAFRREYGLPPHAYQTQVRIDRAKSLLMRGQTPGDVAFALGFYGPSHFGWHFKRLVGVSPGAYAHPAPTKQQFFDTASSSLPATIPLFTS